LKEKYNSDIQENLSAKQIPKDLDLISDADNK
jgi:hypothetical protein